MLTLSAQTPERALVPRTITTQDRSGAVILWDATQDVEHFVHLGTSTRDGLKSLESEAIKIFVRNAASLSSHERHLRVVVSFVQTGATEARYQTKTFEGVQTLLTVAGDLHRGMRFPRDWEEKLRLGVLPHGIIVQVAHDLPAETR